MTPTFWNSNTEVYIPDRVTLTEALDRTRIVGIGAHQDDLEIMAFPGILEAYRLTPPSFLGVVCTDGAGSPRRGPYEKMSDEAMQHIRWNEQNQAADVGRYSAMIQFKYPSSVAKQHDDDHLVEDIKNLLLAAKPESVYTHNLADKHDTHVAVALRTIEAIRRIPSESRPRQLFGIEVWRSLDWIPDSMKKLFPLDTDTHLAPALLGIFDSQIGGGKRYDLAVPARWRANATYLESHSTDEHEFMTLGMDMTPLTSNSALTAEDFLQDYLQRFQNDVMTRLHTLRHGRA